MPHTKPRASYPGFDPPSKSAQAKDTVALGFGRVASVSAVSACTCHVACPLSVSASLYRLVRVLYRALFSHMYDLRPI